MKKKVLNETLILEFACILVVENNETKLNWATYALATHEKRLFLQAAKEATKEKQVISPPSSQQGDVLQLTISATIVPIVPKCVGGVGGRQFVGHLVVSKSHRPPLGGHSRLHALHSLKVKIKGNSTCKNLHIIN
jgi:hypothetical protein